MVLDESALVVVDDVVSFLVMEGRGSHRGLGVRTFFRYRKNRNTAAPAHTRKPTIPSEMPTALAVVLLD